MVAKIPGPERLQTQPARFEVKAAEKLISKAESLKIGEFDAFENEVNRFKKSFTAWQLDVQAACLANFSLQKLSAEARLTSSLARQNFFYKLSLPNFTGEFLKLLEPERARVAFFDAIGSLDHVHTQTKGSGSQVHTEAVDELVSDAREGFDRKAWIEVGEDIMLTMAHTDTLTEQTRRVAAETYMVKTFPNIEIRLYELENRRVMRSDKPLSKKEEEARDLLELQPAVASIVLNPRLSAPFRTAMLSFIRFTLCNKAIQKSVADFAATPGENESLSNEIISWLKLTEKRDLESMIDSRPVLKNILQNRGDAPAVQLQAMDTALTWDFERPLASRRISDTRLFRQIIEKVWADAPHKAMPNHQVYEKLAGHPEGASIIKKMIRSEAPLERMAGGNAAVRLYRDLLDPGVVRRAVRDLIGNIREKKNVEFCGLFAHTLVLHWPFDKGDTLLLRELRQTILAAKPDRWTEETLQSIDGLLKGF